MQRNFNSCRLRRRRHTDRRLNNNGLMHPPIIIIIIQSQLVGTHNIPASHSRFTTLSRGVPSTIGPKYLCCFIVIIFVTQIKRAYSRDNLVVYRAGRVKLELPGKGSWSQSRQSPSSHRAARRDEVKVCDIRASPRRPRGGNDEGGTVTDNSEKDSSLP